MTKPVTVRPHWRIQNGRPTKVRVYYRPRPYRRL